MADAIDASSCYGSSHDIDTEGAVADRIRQLCEIDQRIVSLLHSAGSAIHALTNKPDLQASDADPNLKTDLDRQKRMFSAATATYFSSLSEVDVGLRRQIYALEEAGVLPPESSSATAVIARDGGNATSATGMLLDTGYLNTRKDRTRANVEQEQWRTLRHLLDRAESGNGT